MTIDLTAPAGTLIKTTLVDYPGKVACSFFLKGCNLRCPYCYNRELVLGDSRLQTFVSAETVIRHLAHRKNVLSGFVISGGEPLLNPLTAELIKKARLLGYKIKLDTNGTLPDRLQDFLADNLLRPDFIALDIKTSPERYEIMLSPKSSKKEENIVSAGIPMQKLFAGDFLAEPDTLGERLIRSIKLVSTYPSESREFRTVLVPGLVDENDISRIADILPHDASWQFAQFRNENCIDSSYNTRDPYLDAKLKELVAYAKKRIPGAELR